MESVVSKQTVKDKFSSRKLWIFIVLFMLSTTALFTGFAEFPDWAEFIKWMFGIYAGANAFVHGSRAAAMASVAKLNGNGGRKAEGGEANVK